MEMCSFLAHPVAIKIFKVSLKYTKHGNTYSFIYMFSEA